MAYNITTTASATLATIADGTVNSSATSLTLIGKNYAGYGNFLNENYVKLLENFALDNPPRAPLTGQLWYDSNYRVLNVYDGVSGVWKTLSSSTSQTTAPGNPLIGDFWWDTTNQQLKVWGGVLWVTVGPTYTSVSGTSGAVVETILDSVGNQHIVIKLYISDKVVGLLSSSYPSFTPQTAIAGFSVINPGFNLIDKTSLPGSQVTGDVSNALTLQGVKASQFIRSDQNSGTSYVLTAGGGLIVGSDLNISPVPATNEIKLTTVTLNRDFNIYVNRGGITTKAIGIAGSTASVTFANAVTIGSLVSPATLDVTGAVTASSTVRITGNTTVGSYVLPAASGTVSIGTATNTFANVYAQNFNGPVTGNVSGYLTGTIQTAVQPNITRVGTLSNLNVTGNLVVGNINASYGVIGTILTPIQTNITSVGTLSGLALTGTLDHNGFLSGSVNSLSGGLYQAQQFYLLQSPVTGSNNNSAQNVLGVGVSLVGSTIYEFEGLFALSKTAGTTAHTISLGFAAGSGLSLNNIMYNVITDHNTTTPASNSGNVSVGYTTVATPVAIVSSTTTAAANATVLIKGTVSVSNGGTWTPQYTLSVAPGGAYTTNVGSYFKITPLAASGSNVVRGTWA